MREQRLRWFEHVKRMDGERTSINARDFVEGGIRRASLRDGKM